MLTGHAEGMPRLGSRGMLLADPVSELDGDEESDVSAQIIYMASFEELAEKNIQYDTIIWLSISLLLVLAWGIGIIMLLYLPIRRYVLRKDILSRKLYVTTNEIVYKVSRPSFVPFRGVIKIEKHIPLCVVIDIIIEQGCLQSTYGIHTFRVESIARGHAAAVDELQVQGVYDPGLLKKVIITEASKVIPEVQRNWNLSILKTEAESMVRTASLTGGPAVIRSPSRSSKSAGVYYQVSLDHRGTIPQDLLLQKLEEVSQSVKNIELLIEKTQAPSKSI